MGDVQSSTWPIAVADSGPPLSLDDVVAAEGHLGEPIPAAYREFLLTHNGGRPQPARYTVPAGTCRPSRQARVEWFLGITGGLVADNDLEEHRALAKPTFPDLSPVAWDSDWKLILIGLGGNWARDAVYNYDNEQMLNEAAVPLLEDVRFLAVNFASFLQRLY